ncbi:transglutaminase [Paenibacillus sp. J31TS4]|uniref:DUF4129 domain-containing transglutaminase family protein n=1 Tax=Paenibacillus sp. J31TS4 TaxID=2807195 RepID=UPI001B179202|nr:transglutaminase domain-containing protein [Paenibacillus sp. J31TS4]GIP39545.1 transglutaminase [Paenibacillus sp. J31TS4]
MNRQRGYLAGLVLDNWPQKLTLFFTGMFLWQFVGWISEEDGLWLPETVLYVKGALLLTFVLEMLTYRLQWSRGGLQGLLLLAYSGYVVGYRPVGWERGEGILESLRLWADGNLVQLHPFVWFIMGAWAIYHVAVWWVQARWRIYVLLFLGVTAIAVRDSFSQLILWQEAALLVLSGLCLLIVHQFARLRRHHPAGWSHLAEYPVSSAVPVVLLLAVMFLPGLLAPNVPNLVTDPYTLWKAWQGETVSTNGKGTGAFLTPLDATSGYSRSDQKLGGGFNFDYNPIMQVETSYRSYWRGETRSLYNGKGWEKSQGDRQGPVSGSIGPDSQLPKDSRINTSRLRTLEIEQTVSMLTDDTYPVLFGAYAIQSVEALADERTFDRLQWAVRSAELRWSERGRPPFPKQYKLVSQMPISTEEELNSAEEPANKAALEEYLQLPASTPARVKQLALDVTRGADTPYAKAKSIERYLQTNFRYTNKPNQNGSDNMDFVDRFLFEIREGYCDYFSTSMAVMARSVGLPTRWVKGFAPGSPIIDSPLGGDTLEGDMPPIDAAGTYVVRNSDAHSWVEVYLQGYGWIPFEPTSGFAMPVAPAPDEPGSSPVQQPDTETEASAAPVEPEAAPSGNGSRPWLLLGVGSGAAAVLLAVLAGTRTGRRWLRGLVGGRQASDWNERVIAEYNRLLRYLRRKGRPAYDYETARETVSRLSAQDVWAARDLQQLLQLFEKAKYSPRSLSAEEYTHAAALVKRLKETM